MAKKMIEEPDVKILLEIDKTGKINATTLKKPVPWKMKEWEQIDTKTMVKNLHSLVGCNILQKKIEDCKE